MRLFQIVELAVLSSYLNSMIFTNALQFGLKKSPKTSLFHQRGSSVTNIHRNGISHLYSTTESDTSSPSSPETTKKIYKKQKKEKPFRARQHVNPLARAYQIPIELEKTWVDKNYTDPSLPLYLDIGCSKGGFLLDLATQHVAPSHSELEGDVKDPFEQTKGMNFLGVEIRNSVAEYAQTRVDKREYLQGRLNFIGCNANVDLDRLLNDYCSNSGASLEYASIQFPDPHFKKRNHKRRVVNSELIMTIAKYMKKEGSIFFLQSDVKEGE